MEPEGQTGITYTDEGEGRPIVLIHGFPLSRGVWAPQVEALRSTHRVIVPDLRGFGESPPGSLTGGVPMERYADDVAELLDELGAPPAVIAGHSMGGYVALAFARRHAERLAGLVLVATRAVADSAEVAAGRRVTAEKVLAEGGQGMAALIEGMVPKLVAPGTDDPDLLESVRVAMASASPEGTIGALLGMAERSDSTAMLPEIDVPTLVITGAEDTLIPVAESEAMAEAIPGAELVVLAGAGHLVSYERPEAFNRELTDWLGRSRT